jgi:hypothetical protein
MSKGGVDKRRILSFKKQPEMYVTQLTVFFSLLNIVGINIQIIYKSNLHIVIP